MWDFKILGGQKIKLCFGRWTLRTFLFHIDFQYKTNCIPEESPYAEGHQAVAAVI